MEDTLTAPLVEGNAPEIAPSETQAPAQVVPETQDTSVSQVEENVNKPQAVEPQRPKVSSYYKERERVRRIEEDSRKQAQELAEMKRLYQELKNPKPEDSAIQKLTAEELLNDPDAALKKREERLLKEFYSLKEELNQLKSKEANAEVLKSEREALEMLFPKSSPESDEPLEVRLENAERKELLDKVFKANPSLDRLMRIDPKGAAEFVLQKLSQMKPVSSPNAIPKALMGSTARGNPGASKATVGSLMSELKKLTQEASSKPEVRFNPEHRAKRESLMKQIGSLMQE